MNHSVESETRRFAKQLRFSDETEAKNSTETIGRDQPNSIEPKQDGAKQQEANANELKKHERSQTQDKQAETSETSSNEAGDESEEANGKSMAFEELSKDGEKERDIDKEVSSRDDLDEEELDLLEAADWPLSDSPVGSIDRRALQFGAQSDAKNGTTSRRLASLIAHRPFGLRNLAWNSTVLRALERRRLKQRERLRRLKRLQSQSNKGARSRGGNKKRDLNDQPQTRQSSTTTTTLGPEPSLLAGTMVKNQPGVSYLKTSPFKLLPSLGASSNQLSSAFQRLISGKLGLSSGMSQQGALDTNQDLTLLYGNKTLAGDSNGRKHLFNLGLDSNQLLELSPDPVDYDQADFSSTSASGQHQSLMPSKSLVLSGGGGNFDGAQHHFDISSSSFSGPFEHESQESGEADQLAGEQLAELMDQQQHWTQSESINDAGGLQSLQAAQRLNRLKSLAVKSGRGKEVSLVRANTVDKKRLIPVEIIGLDPSVTNSILFGSNSQLELNSIRPQAKPSEVQSEQIADELVNGNQQTNQVAGANEFIVQDSAGSSNSTAPFASSQQQAGKQDQSIEFQQSDTRDQVENSLQEPPKLSNPSSVLHVHHFHHTGDHVTKAQEVESGGGEQANESSQAQAEPTSGRGEMSTQVLVKPEFVSSLQANSSSNPNEGVEMPVSVEQIQEENKAEAKQVRFVTRNSSVQAEVQPDDAARKQQVSLVQDETTSHGQPNQVSSSRFTPIGHGPAFNLAQNSIESAAPMANGMLMVAYKPAGRVPTQSVDSQSADQFQPIPVGQSDLWSAANFMNGLSRGKQTHPGEFNSQAHFSPHPNHRPPFNEGSESSHTTLNSVQEAQQRQRQRLFDGALAATNSSQSHMAPPFGSLNLNYQRQLASALSKQPPKLNPLILAQLQEKLTGEPIKLVDPPAWTSEDERLLAQFGGPNGRRNNNNNPALNYTSQNNHQLKLEGRNPFQNHYQNLVANLVMLKQLRQKSEEGQIQALLNGNHQLQGMSFTGKEPTASASRPAMSTSGSQHLTAAKPSQNEIAVILQEQLSKQLQNRTLPSGHQLTLNATSGRYELTMASDRAPANLQRDQQQQVAGGLASSTSSPRPIVLDQGNQQQTFSANENFHVPNTSSQNGDTKLVVAPVITKSSRPASQATGQNQNLELETTRGIGNVSRPSVRTNESFMDSTESVNNLALAFIFVVSLLTFILIAASLIYRRRRTGIGGESSRRNVDLSSSRPSAGFSIAQRTKRLMRSNMFAGASRSRLQQQAAGAPISLPNRVSSVSSSGASLGGMADGGLPRETEPKAAQKILSLHHSHQSDGLATRSSWAKHLRPVLRRAPTLQPGACAKQDAGSSQLARGDNYNMNKYVGASNNNTNNNNNSGNKNNLNNIGATFDLSQRRSQAATVAPRLVGQEKYPTATNETTTNATTTTISSTNDDDSLASNPDSDIRTLNTRLHKVTLAYAHHQHEPIPRQDWPAGVKSSPDLASIRKKKPQQRRAAH